MFTEVLRIKPQLDRGDLQRMDRTLTQRFTRVAKGFGGALKSAMKGTVLGISIALINRLLNPIKELEERMKSLLGIGSDVEERSKKLGTTAGDLLRLRGAASEKGVTTEELDSTLDAYAETLRNAEKELKEGKDISPATEAVRQFVGDKDIADSLRRLFIGLNRANPQERKKAEEAIFGSEQTGSVRRAIDQGLDFSKQRDSATLTESVKNLSERRNQELAQEQLQQQQNVIQGAKAITPGAVSALGDLQAQEDASGIKRLSQIEIEAKNAKSIEEIKETFGQLMTLVTSLVAELRPVFQWFNGLGAPQKLIELLKRAGGR